MEQEQNNQRRQYVEQARNSFSSGEKGHWHDEEQEPRSFFKLRLAVSALLFLTVLLMKWTDLSFHGVDAGRIAEIIQYSAQDLHTLIHPGSVSD